MYMILHTFSITSSSAEPEEVDKLDRMLSLLREEEGEDPSGML